MQIGGKKLPSVEVVLAVNLLILRVGTIIGGANGQEEDALPGHLLKGQRHGDGAALANQIWLDAVH